MPLLKKNKKTGAHGVSSASPEKCFWVWNGPVLKDLGDLRDALREMSDEQFDYHTKRAGNDFARWVRDVLGDHDCAKKIENAASRLLALEIVGECLAR
jgi:hypothetical protein